MNFTTQVSQQQYGLALHTTTPELGLALDNFTGDACQSVSDLGRDMAMELHLRLTDFLQPRPWQDLQFIAVAKGPGGFTGTRMGVVVARTLAQQLELPLFAFSTLAAYAEKHWADGTIDPQTPIAVTMRAQRGQIFAALYKRFQVTPSVEAHGRAIPPLSLPKAVWGDEVLAPEAWQAKFAGWQSEESLSGDFPPIALEAKSGLADSVSSLLQMAHNAYKLGQRPHWKDAVPFYGQHPVTLPPSSKSNTSA